ncbi:MAG: Gfo/Idh/MocA family oxidoreductase [Atribacterota bacterium]
MERKEFYEIDYQNRGIPELGIGVLGYGFMGKVHSNAYLKIPYTFPSPSAHPALIAMCGRDEKGVADIAQRFGYQGYYTDWMLMANDPRIDVLDNCTPDNMHFLPTIQAMEAGKHVICEKPLALTLQNAREMWEKARKTGVKNMCCYNYRFIPAIRLARELIEKNFLGKIYQFRGRYLQEPGRNLNEPVEKVWYATGTQSGTLLGIGCHLLDMARFLVGEISALSGLKKTFNPLRSNRNGESLLVTGDESTIALLEFENGAIGTFECSGVSTGRKNQLGWEINGSRGSLAFDLEDLNHLQVYSTEIPLPEITGFSNVSVTDSIHPLQALHLPTGHNGGWEYGHVHALHHFMECVAKNISVEPYGATFEDGFRVQVLIEAVNESSRKGKRVEVKEFI